MKSSRISMFLCCRWWNSCRTSFSSLPRIHRWLPSRLSKCRRSCLTEFHSVLWSVVLRRKQNSWWKCLRSYPFLLCTGLWSRSLTFRFLLLVVVVGEVFKIYPLQDFGSEFWPKRACRFLQGGCQQGQACTFAHSVHRLHPDAPWEEFMKLFCVGEQDAVYGPEIMPLVFHQSKSYIYLVVPQLQFIDRVLDISVVPHSIGTHSANCAEDGRFHGCSSSGGCWNAR